MGSPPAPLLFARDGHLLDLALARLAADDPERVARAAPHLEACEGCRARLVATRMAHEPLPPLRLPAAAPATAHPLRPRRPWMAPAASVLALAAAALVWVGLPDPAPEPGFRARGADLGLAVWAHDGEQSRPVVHGDAVRPAERLGFKVRSADAGHVLVVGVDGSGEVYLCAPQRGGASQPLAASPEFVEIPGAVRLDGRPGTERLVALRCPEPFGLEDLRAPLQRAARDASAGDALAALHSGCAQDTVVPHKELGDGGGARP